MTKIGSLGSTADNANDPPVTFARSVATDEDAAVVIDVLKDAYDDDGSINATTVTVSTHPMNGIVEIDPLSGEVSYTPTMGIFGIDVFSFTVEDDTGALSAPAIVTVTVNEVNLAPTAIQIQDGEVPESLSGAVIGKLTVEDPDVNDTHTFSISDARFEVVDGVLKLADEVSLDYETEQSVTLEITAADSASQPLSVTQTFTLAVVNAKPVAEDDAADTGQDVAVKIAVLDNDTYSDGTINPTTVKVIEEPGSGSAGVDTVTGEITYTPNADFWGADMFRYTVEGNDGRASSGATVTIQVNDAPSAVTLDNTSVGENAAGAVVGDIAVTDKNIGQVHTLSVSDPRFEIVDGQLKLLEDARLDHETEATLEIELTVFDSGTPPLSATETVTLTVVDVNDSPYLTANVSDQRIAKNVEFKFTIPQGMFADADKADILTYAAELDDGSPLPAWLAFDGVSRTFSGAPTAAEVGSVEVRVTATDSGDPPLSASDVFTLRVTHLAAPWRNPANALDVNNDGSVTTEDARVLLDAFSRHGYRELPNPPTAGEEPPPYLDVNGDEFLSAYDVIPLIKALNDMQLGEGELPLLTLVSDQRFEVAEGELRLKPGTTFNAESEASIQVVVTVFVPVTSAGSLAANIPVELHARPWQNPSLRNDVNGDGMVSPIDALITINALNAEGARTLPLVPVQQQPPGRFVDTNGDHMLSPIDALLIINQLNSAQTNTAEGEAVETSGSKVLGFETSQPRESVFTVPDRSSNLAVPDNSLTTASVILTGTEAEEGTVRSMGDMGQQLGEDDEATEDLETVLEEIAEDISSVWEN